MKLLLDSVILIDHFNGRPEAGDFLSKHWRDSALSVITRAEALTGFAPPERDLALKFLNRFPTLEMKALQADLAARLRRDRGWNLPDAFQAAVALSRDLKLVTRNRKDFDPGIDSFVWIPYQF